MKKPNPQDATLRNIRALKARVTKLEQRLDALTKPSAAMRKLAAIDKRYADAFKA